MKRLRACARSEAGKLRENIEEHALGRRMVSARVFRQRRTARIGVEPRMPDRLDPAKLVGPFASGGSRAFAAGDGGGGPAACEARHRPSSNCSIRRLTRADLNPGYIKGYVPGRARERRPIHPRRDLDRHGVRRHGRPARAWELFQLINPIRHGDSEAAIDKYKVEPYVVAADVYANPQHAGRGGWTWYTGSAGWMYRLITESLLGLQSGRGSTSLYALPAAGLANIQDPLPLPRNLLSHHFPQPRQAGRSSNALRQTEQISRARSCG